MHEISSSPVETHSRVVVRFICPSALFLVHKRGATKHTQASIVKSFAKLPRL